MSQELSFRVEIDQRYSVSSLEWSILLPHDKTPEKQDRSGQVYGRVKAHDKVWGQQHMLRGVDFWFYLKF